jgi:hypothetical protein
MSVELQHITSMAFKENVFIKKNNQYNQHVLLTYIKQCNTKVHILHFHHAIILTQNFIQDPSLKVKSTYI